jgi:hypothetical protein
MNMIDDVNDKAPEHWGELIAFLSMDATDPFWLALGYAPAKSMPEVREDIRAAITTLRERAAASPSDLPDIRALFFIENAMDWPEAELEKLASLGLHDFVADHVDAPHLSGWQIALSTFPDGYPRTRAALATEDAAALSDTVVAERDGFSEAIDQPKKLSAWDVQMCARHGWNPEDENGFLPFDTLLIAISMRATHRALSVFAGSASPSSQRVLHDEAAETIETMGVWMPEPLAPLMLKVS